MQKILKSWSWSFLLGSIYFIYQWRTLSSFSLNGDEPFSVFTAQGDLFHIWKELMKGNNPPLYESILHGWIQAFGISEKAVRSLSLLAASGVLILVYDVLKRWSLRWAHITVLLLFFSNYFQLHATEARGYALFMLLSVWATREWLLYLDSNRTFPLIRYVVVSGLMLYTHFFAWWIILTHLFLLLSTKKHKPIEWKKVGLVAAAIVLLYSPYGWIFFQRLWSSVSNGTWVAPITNMGSLHDFFYWAGNQYTTLYALIILLFMWAIEMSLQRALTQRIYYWPIRVLMVFFTFFALSIYLPMPYYWEFSSEWKWFYIYSTWLALGLLYFLFISSRFSWKEKWLIGMWSIPLFLIFLVSTKVPMYLDRYVSFCLPFFYMSLGGLILLMGKKRFWLGAFLIMTFFFITAHRMVPEKRQVRALVHEMKQMSLDSNTVFVICPDYFDLNVLYYWDQEKFCQWGEQDASKEEVAKGLIHEQIWAVRDSSELSSLLNSTTLSQCVYLDASADFSIPGNGVLQWLEEHFNKKGEQEIPEHFKLRSFEISRN
jgi:Dolichyl-phosphate-mannose-protein mannosyltransferase